MTPPLADNDEEIQGPDTDRSQTDSVALWQPNDRLNFHIDNARLGMIEWDGDWHVQRWSPIAEEIFGWTAQEVAIQEWESWAFVYEDDEPRIRNLTDRLVRGERESASVINRNYTKDGRIVTCEWFISVLRDRRGQVVSFLSFVQDVTQRLSTAAELAVGRAQLQERFDQLTPREVQVMDAVSQGQLNKQIAFELRLSHKTVEVYRARVMTKMNAGSLAELVRMAVMLDR